MWINIENGYVQDWLTQQWVKATGRKIPELHSHWLSSPTGDTDKIGSQFISRLVKEHDLELVKNKPQTGLIESIDDWQLTEEEKDKLHPLIIHFYEKTVNYHFEIWSNWCGAFRPFGKMLSVIFSKRLQQLNLPLNPLDAAKGIESNIIKLVEKGSGKTKHTIWYRKLKATDHVIYSGVYDTAFAPNHNRKCMKVSFPLPNGSATVVMRITVMEDGSLLLQSNGKKFGDPGFYFTLTDGKQKHWARFVKSMHEYIKVYVDAEGELRADHNLYFYGLPFLQLYYKMKAK